MLFDRMSALDEEQLDKMEERVAEFLEIPWDKGTGRPRELTFRETLVVTCGYMRQNIVEEVWADIFRRGPVHDLADHHVPHPLVEQVTDGFRLTADEAAEVTKGVIALVDGTLWPCWSWDGEDELWSGKYKTTGHGSLIITNLQGRITFVSEPCHWQPARHGELQGSDVERILRKAGEMFGDKRFIGNLLHHHYHPQAAIPGPQSGFTSSRRVLHNPQCILVKVH